MTETFEVPSSQTRSRLKKGGLALVGVAAIGALATLTASQWTDSVQVDGNASAGTFSINIDNTELGFSEFGPSTLVDTYSEPLSNTSSSETAVISLTASSGLDAEHFGFTVTLDGEDMLVEGASVEIPAGEDAPLVVTATLDNNNDSQGATSDVSLTFTGTTTAD